MAHLEHTTAIERGVIVLKVDIGEVAADAVAVDAAALAAEGLQCAVLREEAAHHIAGAVVVVQPAAQIRHLLESALAATA